MTRGSGVFSRSARDPRTPGDPSSSPGHRTQAVGYALRRLPEVERKYEVLDLGQACGETLSFYAELPSKVYFAGFFSDLKAMALDPEEGLPAFERACERILPFPPRTRFDLVCTWDLFNYLSGEEIGALTTYLRRFMTESAPLVSLIWYQGRIPAQPQRFAVLDEENVEYRLTSQGEMDGPRYKEPALLRAMSSFRVSKSFLLRNGIQEYVFQPVAQSQSSADGHDDYDWG